MKKFLPALFVFLLTIPACANPKPVLDFVSLPQQAYVLLGALFVEACTVTLILIFFNMCLKPVFYAVFASNIIIYFVVFLPLLYKTENLCLSEIIIVLIDATIIKLLTCSLTFTELNFQRIRWPYILLIALIGNTMSYITGQAMYSDDWIYWFDIAFVF